MDRLNLALSGMPHKTDEALWEYVVKEREECRREIERLNKSRNKWGQKYTNLLKSVMR